MLVCEKLKQYGMAAMVKKNSRLLRRLGQLTPTIVEEDVVVWFWDFVMNKHCSRRPPW